MKKIIPALIFMILMASCGPSKEEIRQSEIEFAVWQVNQAQAELKEIQDLHRNQVWLLNKGVQVKKIPLDTINAWCAEKLLKEYRWKMKLDSLRGIN